jgi:hypothetical protein
MAAHIHVAAANGSDFDNFFEPENSPAALRILMKTR